MLHRKCVPVLLLAGMLGGLLLCACRPVRAPAIDAATTVQIDAIVQRTMRAYQAPGFALCIVQDGQVVYQKGYGLADVAAARPFTPQSVSIQASVTKPLVAMAVLRLVDQGVLDLDAPATRYLPAFHMADDRYGAITVRMLLAHTSGLPDKPKVWDEALDPIADPLAQAVADLAGQRLLFAPGTGWSYSNYGYSILGATIAAAGGRPFATYMQEEWLQPLGMAHSTFRAEEVDPDQRVIAYTGDARGYPAATALDCDARDAPDCTLWSSCEDMARWAQRLTTLGAGQNGRLITAAARDAMWAA
jgi:CubicO group peptidase (beta-lactamase class C family)